MSLYEKICGRPLNSNQSTKQELSIWTGVPALGLDALASTAYGPEAALLILLPLGAVGLQYFFPITLMMIGILFVLYLTHLQAAAAYPNGGGAYIVASDNLGPKSGLLAGIALMLDYLLNVAVGISAGVGAIVSAIPSLQPYMLILCLVVLLLLTILNLRGIRETGLAFIIPTIIFVGCLVASFLIGLFNTVETGGSPIPIVPPTPFPETMKTISIWLLLGAFANGLTAMTGVEAVSNAVPLFKKPSVKNAQITLTLIIGILVLFLLALGYLCPSYHIIAMDESQIGYKTILSQLISSITGIGFFYYFSMISIFIVLIYSAQTSFADFPRVCRLLADDNFLPHFLAERGPRLVYSYGIMLLAVSSAVLLVLFDGITFKLIPLFAVGAFTAFFFSQVGMVKYWTHKVRKNRLKIFLNFVGAVLIGTALLIIIAAKFYDGAWIVLMITGGLFILLSRIKRHYAKVMHKLEKPLKLQPFEHKSPLVIIPIHGWNALTEKALRFALFLSNDITALHVSIESEEKNKELQDLWTKMVEKPTESIDATIPRLKILKSPYRRINKPILDYVKKIKKEQPDRLIAVIIPEVIEAHWYEYLLHNIHAATLRTILFLERDQRTVVITIPWYLREK